MMEQKGLKTNMKKTKSMVTGNKARERIDSVRKMAMWMLWNRGGSKLCFVLSVINGVTNNAQVRNLQGVQERGL